MINSDKPFYFLDFEETKILFSIFSSENIEARFVGGCVRDALIFKYTNDFDIAINAKVEYITEVLRKNKIKYIETGIKYGSITVIINNIAFEITSLRTDEKCFGRDCDIKNISDFEEDAKRRDFTINAMYVSFDGRLFDYFNGKEDLKNRRVIFIGDPESRIIEDNLRILRYYRFCSIFNDLSCRYSDILSQNAHFIKTLPIERIQKELFKTLDSKNCFDIVHIMKKDSILDQLFDVVFLKEFCSLKNIEKNINLCVKLYVLFKFEDLMLIFKLNKNQKKTIKLYKKFENESYEYCYAKNGSDFTFDIMIIKFAKQKINPDFNKNFHDLGNFPVTFHDLPCGIKNAGKLLSSCEKWWIENHGKKTKSECMDFIINLSNLFE